MIDYEMFCGITPPPATPASNPDESPCRTWRRREDPSSESSVIDVREQDEHQIAHINGVPLFPLSVYRSSSPS